jgi:predicted DNA-binding protein with PD1-like motif
MDYRKFGETFYIRIDKGEEIISNILEICRKEGIRSAVYSGIGGCKEAEIQTFIPESGTFETHTYTGMLELVSLNGNIITDEKGDYYHHAHAAFAYKESGRHCYSAGHIKSVTVLYTAEIELRPVIGGVIKRKYNEETGTGFWDFK